MIRLHCTKKLQAKLPLSDDGRLPGRLSGEVVAESPLSGWHANLLLMQRRQCVLFVHDATRFPLFIPALKKPDFAELDYYFQDALMNSLLKLGATDAQMKAAEQLLAPLVCDSATDRSVLGTLNQMGQELEYMLVYDGAHVTDLSPYATSVWLAERPCQIRGKDWVWPGRALLELLDGHSAKELP